MTTLSEYLKAAGMSQRQFATSVGLSTTYVSEIVAGTKTPSLSAALRIQSATNNGVNLQTLLKPAAVVGSSREARP